MIAETDAPPRRNRYLAWTLRAIGIIILIYLFLRLDLSEITSVIFATNIQLLSISILLFLPLIFVKTIRWMFILRAQALHLDLVTAYLAYLGSIFIGFLTPGRLGEFVRAIYVKQHNHTSTGKAFSSVFIDRLFDLFALIAVSVFALLLTECDGNDVWIIFLLILIIAALLLLFLMDNSYHWIQRTGSRMGTFIESLFASGSWLSEIRIGIKLLTISQITLALLITLLAYVIFFGQGYLLARALSLPLTILTSTFAVALGSLIALLPISISGLGTREAAIIAYLGTLGISAEKALSFSLLIFLTFNIVGGAFGAMAWILRPVPFSREQLEDMGNL